MSPFNLDDADEQPIEIEIQDVDPETGEEVYMSYSEDSEEVPEFDANLAEYLDDDYLYGLANDLIHDYDNDRNSRKDWEDTYKDGLDLLGLKYDDRMEPWPGACGVNHPLLLEAVVRFQAEMITETLPASGPVSTEIFGKQTPEKQQAAERVAADMNYQIMKKMPEFRNEQERTFWAQALIGSAFKKVYFDPTLGRQTSVFIPAEDFVVSYGTSDLASCPRATYVMRKSHNELRKLQVSGFYKDVEIEKPAKHTEKIQDAKDKEGGYSAIYDDRHILLEMMVDLNLEGFEDLGEDGEPTEIALPYVVTIEKTSMEIIGIRRNWKEDDKLKTKKQYYVHYPYVPADGFYGFGLIQIIGGFAKSATSIVRQLVDAGTLSNLPAGFKTRGMRVLGDDTPISPGEFKDVDIPSGALKDNILPLPYKEPSAVLYQLLQTVVDEGRRMGSVADLKVADMNGQTPVGTTLAILERTLKVMSAVQSRVYHALDQELKLLADIIKDSGDEGYDIVFTDDKPHSRAEDYGNVEITPTSNPNASTMAQRVMQYQAAVQLAQQTPQIYDLANLHRQMLEALGIENVESLIPSSKETKPMDPVSENMNLMKGTKVKAFIYQDHMAHMTIHTNLLNDPKMAQAFQNMTNGQQIQAAIQAHVMEHAAFQYRAEMEQMMGVELPKPDEEIPTDMETKLSKLLAEASDMLLQKDQNEAAQQQAQQQAQDPVIQMQQKELAIKEMEVKGKLDIEQKKIDLQERVAILNASAKGDELAAKHAINLMGAEQAMEQMQLNQAAKEQQLAMQQQAQEAQQQQAMQQLAQQQQPPSGQPQ
jgi:hypothetical protein